MATVWINEFYKYYSRISHTIKNFKEDEFVERTEDGFTEILNLERIYCNKMISEPT